MSERRRLCITKRACIALMLFVVAGAIVNVAVAWSIVVARPKMPSPVTLIENSRHAPVPHEWPPEPSLTQILRDFGKTEFRGTAVGPGGMRYQLCRQYGFPTRSLFWERHSVVGAQQSVVSTWEPHRLLEGIFLSDRYPTQDDHVLPFRPIWPGFAINTVFYAFILWLLFAVPFAMRRRRRIKRGLCPKCAYPVGTSAVCTECGAALSRKVETSTSPNVQSPNP